MLGGYPASPMVQGSMIGTSTPTAVKGLDPLTALWSGSGAHDCGKRRDGSLYCWGDHRSGFEPTDPKYVASTFEAWEIPAAHDADAIDIGADFACALSPTGIVSCWGGDDAGQLGDGSTTGPRKIAAPMAW